MDLMDEEGYEILLYTHNEYHIKHHLPTHSENAKPHDVLMNLYYVSSLFKDGFFDDSYDELFDDIQASSVKYYVYFQAGFIIAKHFQANRLVSNFQKQPNQLNARILLDYHPKQDSNTDTHQLVPIIGIGCQGYNVLIHCTQGLRSQQHDAQKGAVTAALSGFWATMGGGMDNIAHHLKLQCTHQLPHQTYDCKLADQQINRDLHLKNIYAIDVHALLEIFRNGK
jgi:hypothetical protein